MRVLSMIVLLTLLGTSAVLPSQAQNDNANRCNGSDPDLIIAGCTAIIQLGGGNNVNLAMAFMNRGVAYRKKGNYDRAIQDYDQAIRLNPSDPDAFYDRGIAYYVKGNYDRAIQDYDQAIRLNSSHAGAFYGRGTAYYKKSNYDRAIQDYDQAIRLNPSFANAFYWRGMAKRKAGDTAGGDADIAKARQLDPKLSVVPAGTITYNLTTAEDANSGGSNPSGPWGFLGGSTILHFNTIPQPSGSCFSRYPGLTTDWSAGNVSGNCIPAFAVASGTGPGSPPDFLAGDVLVHSQDNGNSSANGQAFVTWTAPVSGTITVGGLIWYAQSAQQRSNEFTLTLGGSNTLASGTVAYNSPVGNSRANPLHFGGGGMLAVTAGEVLALEIQRSPGQPYGSIDGVDLTVTETTTTQ